MKLYRPILLLLAIFLFNLICKAEESINKKPNVIVIITDDHGYGDLGVYGGNDLKTPNIDNLCNSGVRFTNWYANAPVCAPTRASIMTGKYPRKAGVPNLLGVREPGIHLSQKTIANAFNSLGYSTGLIGKWHNGAAEGYKPNKRGFDYFFGILEGCVDYFSHMYFLPRLHRPFHDLWRNEEPAWEDGKYLTHLITNESLQFIKDNKDTSFYLNIAYNAPHYPLQVPRKYIAEFEGLNQERQAIAALLLAVDEGIGQLMSELEKLKLLENTIILFQGDNGPSNEKRNFYSDYENERFEGSSKGNLNGNKGSLFEGGIRVPAAISWKGVIPAGNVNHNIGTSMDIFPTVFSMVGGNLENYPDLDGKNLTQMIVDGAESPHKIVFWEYRDQRAIREGNWKLIKNPWLDFERQLSDTLMLFNLETDVSESKNLVNEYPEKAKMLLNKLNHIDQTLLNPYDVEK
jgi:arylsulfatase A-like enzyme